MPAPDPAQYERIAQAASKEATILDDLGGRISTLGDRASALIGGTATGEDRQMIRLTHEACTLLRRASQQLSEGAALARQAAREAQEMAEAEARQARQS